MISELDLLREKNPKKLLELIIQFETDKTHKGVIYSKNSCTPKTTLNGQNWLDHLSHLSEFISILDLGAGDTLAQYLNPYEENIIDSELAEYSQLLQSSNSKYEMYNSIDATINKDKIFAEIEGSFGIDYFNDLLLKHIKAKFNYDQYMAIKLLEISQFIRMLPFKKIVDKSKMILFYGLASDLFSHFQEEEST